MACVKCESCGALLSGPMTFCTSCGVRQHVNLRQLGFRDLGPSNNLPCPHCETALDVIEFDTQPAVQVELCKSCRGMFFNPGELECLLDRRTRPTAGIDKPQLKHLSEQLDAPGVVIYRKCPMCSERMSHLNFGGRSGVILDWCGQHGMWVEGHELQALAQWWQAGGKWLHRQQETDRKVKEQLQSAQSRQSGIPVFPDPTPASDWDWLYWLPDVIGAIVEVIFD